MIATLDLDDGLALTSSVIPFSAAIVGEIDIATEAKLEQILGSFALDLIEFQVSEALLDLSDVTFCSAVGIGVVESFVLLADSRGVELTVLASSSVALVARVSGADDRLRRVETN